MVEPAAAQGPEPPFDFSLAGWLVGTRVDEGDAELGAHQGELPGPVVGAVVDVESRGQASAQDRLLEHRQEDRGVLGEGEGGEGDDAGGVVDEGDQVGLAAAAAVGDGRAVHDVAHPQLAGVSVGEAPSVGHRLLGPPVEEAFAGEQAVDGRRREIQVRGDITPAGGVDDGAHGEGRVAGLDGDQEFGDVRRHAAGAAPVAAGPGMQGVEAALAVALEPVADGLGGDAGARRAGDVVVLGGLGAQPSADAGRAARQVGEVGDEAVPEQRHGLPGVVVGCVRHVRVSFAAAAVGQANVRSLSAAGHGPPVVGTSERGSPRRERGGRSRAASAAPGAAARPSRAARGAPRRCPDGRGIQAPWRRSRRGGREEGRARRSGRAARVGSDAAASAWRPPVPSARSVASSRLRPRSASVRRSPRRPRVPRACPAAAPPGSPAAG